MDSVRPGPKIFPWILTVAPLAALPFLFFSQYSIRESTPMFGVVRGLGRPDFTSEEMQQVLHVRRKQSVVDHMRAFVKSWNELPYIYRWLAISLGNFYHSNVLPSFALAPDAQITALKVCAVNVAVWFLWKIPAPTLRGWLSRGFVYDRLNPAWETFGLWLSPLSHRSVVHLSANCIGIALLGEVAFKWMEKQRKIAEGKPDGRPEASQRFQFYAFILAAGSTSTMLSAAYFTTFGYRQIVRELSASRPIGRLTAFLSPRPANLMKAPAPVTLGATGIVYALATHTVFITDAEEKDSKKTQTWADKLFPSWRTTVPFVLSGALAFDVAGLFFGWRRFDHAAHLGGALFGAWYQAYGFELWDICYSKFWWDKVYKDMVESIERQVRLREEEKREKREKEMQERQE